MINRQSYLSAGVPISGAAATADVVISAVQCKVLSLFFTTTNTSPVYLQMFDVATVAAAETGGTWNVSPVAEFEIAAGGSFHTDFSTPVAMTKGCVLLASTSSTSYSADSDIVSVSAQVVLDPASTLGNSVPT